MAFKKIMYNVITFGALLGISAGITSCEGKDTSNKDRKKFQSKLQNTAFNNVNTNRPVCKTKINCEFSTNSGECLCLAKKREKPEFIAI